MSSVLRKKIEAGAGIPPTILQFHEFWDPLQAKVSAWMFDTFGVEVRGVSDGRRVVPGNIAGNQLDGLLTFAFNSTYSPGLCAVAIDDVGARLNAAQRLQQPTEDLEALSPLFRKLLFEAPAIALWRLIAGGLNGHLVFTSQPPLSDLSEAAGGFDPAQRYLMTGFSCTINGQRARLWVVFHLDYVQSHALEFEQTAALSRSASSSKVHDTLRESVKSTTINVEGVLHRISMTIGDCSRLEVGQTIALPDVNTGSVSLCAETVNGSVDIGLCEMGVWKRQRALKLKTPILEPFTRELAKL